MARKKARLARKKGRQRRHRNPDAARRHDGLDRLRPIKFKIYDTPIQVNRAEEVQELAERAVELMWKNDGVGAETLLKQALKLEPAACDLLNNLSAACEMQGRRGEAETLVREIHERNPRYFFGRANLAHLCIREGDIERAIRLVEPLLWQRRMHVTEFSALAAVHIHLCLALSEVEAARGWLEIWCQEVPDHPAQAQWRSKLARTPLGWLLRRAMRRVRGEKRTAAG